MTENILFAGIARSNIRRAAADNGARVLPGDDPIEAQKVVCASISRMLEGKWRGASQLEALQNLDRHALVLSAQLLKRYVEGNAEVGRFERRTWVSAMRLSHSFLKAYEHFLEDLRETADIYGLVHARAVVVALFNHRRIEQLLRSMRYKKRLPEPWRNLHDTYRYAQTRGMAHSAVASEDNAHGTSTTAEQAYVRLLLSDLINTGQFSPRELWWADGWLLQWCRDLHLQARQPPEADDGPINGFAVDPGGTDGLKRVNTHASGIMLFLDPSAIPAMIDQEMQLLRETGSATDPVQRTDNALKLALLAKLKTTCDPAPVQIVRRGERDPVSVPIALIVGLATIVQVLRDGIGPRGGSPGTEPVSWQLRDRSDSGCRIRGKIHDLHVVVPGSLIAFREGEDGAWVVSVVRRLRRLMVDYVELGIEHLGRGPRYVKLVAQRPAIAAPERGEAPKQQCFAALYLPPCERHPTMPIKTLLLPARDLPDDCEVLLLSSNATHTLRLGHPIAQQSDFTWTSFAIVEEADTSVSGVPPNAPVDPYSASVHAA